MNKIYLLGHVGIGLKMSRNWLPLSGNLARNFLQFCFDYSPLLFEEFNGK